MKQRIKKIPLILLIALFFISIENNAKAYTESGDTILVQAFEWEASARRNFWFPPADKSYRKIWMEYTLKCHPPPGISNGGPLSPCGEWDYLAYVYLFDHTGELDSNLLTHPSYVVNGGSPDSVSFSNSPTFTTESRWEYFTVIDSLISQSSTQVGSGNSSVDAPFNTSFSDAHSRYLWRASELQSAGLDSGEITALRFEVESWASIPFQKLTVSLKNTAASELSAVNIAESGMQTVYSKTTSINGAGWQTIQFTNAFVWDNTSNVLVDICFDNSPAPIGAATSLLGESTPWISGIHAAGSGYSLDFEGADHVEIPANIFDDIDSAVTISFWQYGDPAVQPQSDYCFEGYNANNNRVLNVHLPWSNGQVYWDAGNDGSAYDRINKQANTGDYEGKWNHWAFTKDVRNGELKIYLNGILWHSGTGLTRDMTGITTFKIGSNAPGTNHYDGMMDEFQIWNVALNEATIAAWMYKEVDNSHPGFSNLLAYYQFDEAGGISTADASGNNHSGILFGLPNRLNVNGCERLLNYSESMLRPNIIFEQDSFTSHLDSVLTVDTFENAPLNIVLFENPSEPTIPTDTLTVWPADYYNYIFDAGGQVIDSTFVAPDQELHVQHNEYYSDPYEVIERYELARYITPYGFGIDLGQDGFKWMYDVTDFAPLLHDSVDLRTTNGQELLNLRFIMLEGTPPRDVLSIENLITGSHYYGNIVNQTDLLPIVKTLDSTASSFKIRTTTTGHRFGQDPENCAEFCPKLHSWFVNGNKEFEWLLWKSCSDNPIPAQGGTWILDRTGWCPGADADLYEQEITPLVQPGMQVSLDYEIETFGPGGGPGDWVIESQLFTYGEAHFVLDAEIETIIAPTDWEFLDRFNPICSNPVVRIKNGGSALLSYVDIAYWVEGGEKCWYTWTGELKLGESEEVTLPPFDWTGMTENRFYAEVSWPNNWNDENEANNLMSSTFETPPLFETGFIIQLNTNNFPEENRYTIKDENGVEVFVKENMISNFVYRDTMDLDPGCYVFELTDVDLTWMDGNGGDGLSLWFNNNSQFLPPSEFEGNGNLIFRNPDGSLIKIYEPDFGSNVLQHFMIGYPLGEGPDKAPCEEPDHNTGIAENATLDDYININPNPTNGLFMVEIDLPETSNISIKLTDIVGARLIEEVKSSIADESFTFDISNQPDGIYLVEINSLFGSYTSKIVLTSACKKTH